MPKYTTFLAPMAGFTDAPMRQMVASFGVDAVVSEMIASQEWKSKRPGVLEKAERGDLAHGTKYIVQIAGRDADLMAETARFAVDAGAEQIDINMGCPAKKVTSGQTAGAALLREPELLLSIIDTVSNAVDVPVTVKTRLGWDAHTTFKIIPQMVSAGAKMITIHGRTRAQKYTGHADHHAIRAIVENASVPIIANGDITNERIAHSALAASGASGVMVGRGAVGRPWLLAQIRAALRGESMNAPAHITEIIKKHYDLILSHYGSEFGVRAARKHLNVYFEDAPKSFRQEILTELDPRKVIKLISHNTQIMELAC